MKMQKKFLLGIIVLATFTSFIYSKPKKSNYYEITMEELKKADIKNVADRSYRGISIKGFYGGYIGRTDIEIDYSMLEQEIPDVRERIIHHAWEKDFKTCDIKGKTEYSIFKLKIILTEVENLRDIEEYQKDKEQICNRIDIIKQKIAQFKSEFDKTGKSISKGYVYHGIEESKHNTSLLLKGALENGHAYYIPKYQIDNKLNSCAQISDGWNYKTVLVAYESQKIKADILDLEEPDVIIVGGTIPKVIGVTGLQVIKPTYYHFSTVEKWDVDDSYNLPSYSEIKEVEEALGIQQGIIDETL